MLAFLHYFPPNVHYFPQGDGDLIGSEGKSTDDPIGSEGKSTNDPVGSEGKSTRFDQIGRKVNQVRPDWKESQPTIRSDRQRISNVTIRPDRQTTSIVM